MRIEQSAKAAIILRIIGGYLRKRLTNKFDDKEYALRIWKLQTIAACEATWKAERVDNSSLWLSSNTLNDLIPSDIESALDVV